MRVIGGKYKGLKLTTNNIIDTKKGEFLIRPTTDRVKETLFNIIQNSFKINLQKTSFLDIFSGSGSVGIEAISRGSTSVYFVDKEKSACDLIKENLNLLPKKTELEKAEIQVLRRNFFHKELLFQKKFDFIYLDPPYKKFFIEDISRRLIELNVIKNNSLIMLESASQEDEDRHFSLLDRRRIGKTFISFYQFSH